MKKFHQLLLITFVFGASLASAQPSFEKSISNLRNQRYCEVLLGNRHFLNLELKVFNTQGLNLCPEDQWQALSKEAIKKQFDVSMFLVYCNRRTYRTEFKFSRFSTLSKLT